MKEIVVTPTQMKIIENASAMLGVSLFSLMNNAGKCLAENVITLYNRNDFSQGVVVLAGNGNNAGDGFVCANILSTFGIKVSVILLCLEPKTDLAINAFHALSPKVKVLIYGDCDYKGLINSCDVVVDCIFGTGFHGEIDEQISEILQFVNSSESLIIGCDIPSGVSALNGICSDNTLKCDYTVTFGAKKIGMLLSPAREMCGEILTCDIGIPKEAYSQIAEPVTHLDMGYVKRLIPKRSPNSHKGDFGKLLCLCGSKKFTGAAALSVLSALRSGVGLCTLASVECVTNIISGSIFEAIHLPLKEDENGQTDFSSYEEILKVAKTSSAILIGCGLGTSAEISDLVCKLIENVECPIILDADGINAILDRIDILRNTKASIILTPHPGELARLLNISTQEVLERRVELSSKFSKEFGLILISKGAGTVICTPDGSTYVSTTGNAGLSRGGSGDVLAGMISSFVAQGISPVNASCAGVYLHGLAADRVAQKLSMQGMLPTDVINELPLLFKDMER